jgi:SNF family Na+-dependent transporter
LLALAANGGIQKGIELVAKIMMPTIYVFGAILVVRALTLGSPINPDWSPIKALDFIWSPRWDKLNFQGAMAATGQIFFTLSLGMGIVCNYASYLKKDDDIILSGTSMIFLNEIAEVIMGGTIAIPIAYTFLGPEKGMLAGPGLSFMALPNVFRDIAGGQIFGMLWFLILFFAGFTSSIAMYNYLCALLEEDMGIKRKTGAWLVFGLYIIVGLPVGIEPVLIAGSTAYLDSVDFWVGNILLFVLGLLEFIVTGWLLGIKGHDQMNQGAYWKLPKWFYRLFIQGLSPIIMLIFLVGFIVQKVQEGGFKSIVSTPWAIAGQIVVVAVIAIGFFQSYSGLKKKYGVELSSNTVSIVKE